MLPGGWKDSSPKRRGRPGGKASGESAVKQWLARRKGRKEEKGYDRSSRDALGGVSRARSGKEGGTGRGAPLVVTKIADKGDALVKERTVPKRAPLPLKVLPT